jgi:hypothetical protein
MRGPSAKVGGVVRHSVAMKRVGYAAGPRFAAADGLKPPGTATCPDTGVPDVQAV